MPKQSPRERRRETVDLAIVNMNSTLPEGGLKAGDAKVLYSQAMRAVVEEYFVLCTERIANALEKIARNK